MSQMHLNMIKDLVDRIETNLAEEFNILELASSAGLSSWHFQKLFKSLIGDSLGIYIRGRRLSKAAQLLMNSDQNIIDVALEAGFNSHEAFSRAFKTYFDLTPKEFRQQKPSILIKQKPVLSEELLKFMQSRIEREPKITKIEAKRIIGFSAEIVSPFFDPVHCSTIAEPWMNLLQALEKMQTKEQPQWRERFYGITLSKSGNFTEEIVTYIAGIDIGPSEAVLPGMTEYIIPAQFAAVFDISPNVADDNLKQKVDCIYGYWLGNSQYRRGQGVDYELFENIQSIENVMSGNFKASYIIPLQA